MVKFNDIPGAVVMSIITNNLQQETAEDILQLVLNTLVPIIISKFLPVDKCDQVNSQMFEIGQKLLESGRFEAESTRQMIVSSMLSYAHGDAAHKTILGWFNHPEGAILGTENKPIG
jgi:hypothetical protein